MASNILSLYGKFGKYLCFRPLPKLQTHSSRLSSHLSDYDVLYRKSIHQPNEFWAEVAEGVEWMKPYDKVMDNSNPPFTKWFTGGLLNASYNALDRHVEQGRGERTAIIYESPVTGVRFSLSYKELKDRVSRLAGVLSYLGITKNDVVVIYLPMLPEAIVGMLACARIGAIHNLVFGGFAARELSLRIQHSEAKVVLSTSFGVEPFKVVNYKTILDEAISISSHKPKYCIILQRNGFDDVELIPNRDLDWLEEESRAHPHDAVPLDSMHPAYILYTSGTTGSPKGIVRPTGGHTVVLPWTMKAIYNILPNEVWWAASDFGWVVGHSYICYAPLLYGCTTVVYEGKPVGTPDAYQFFRVIKEHNIKSLFVAPTALRAIEKEVSSRDAIPEMPSLKMVYSAGESLDNATRDWAEKAFSAPTLDHWWQTETGYPITAHCAGLGESTVSHVNTGKPFMGFDIRIVNRDGQEVPPGVLGRIVSKLPLPPGTLFTLHKADEQFKNLYFSRMLGYYDTMDAGFKSPDGYISVQAREDDVINVAGHRLSTISLEEAMMLHEDVVEAAVIGVDEKLKGQIPFGFFVAKRGCKTAEDVLMQEVVAIVRKEVGPVAAFKQCARVDYLPKTRSGKIPRGSFARIAKNENITISSTIEDPTYYEGIVKSLQKHGYARNISYPFKKSNIDSIQRK